jgi:hypothetical protein
MADIPHQIELDVGAALECAEAATWSANELVARTLKRPLPEGRLPPHYTTPIAPKCT